jgi:hypothetical protein
VGGTLASVLAVAAAAWTFGLLPGTRPSGEMKADVELARARAEAEDERRRAAAADARRAQEEKRAAENRARAEAEVAKARAEAEAARRKAAAELAAAAEARRAAEAAARTSAPARRPPPPEVAQRAAPQPPAAPPQRLAARAAAVPSDYSGRWSAEVSCRAFGARPAFASRIPISVTDNTFNLKQGESGKPGSFEVSGTPGPDGQLQLAGDGIAPGSGRRAPGQPYKAAFDARYGGGRFEGQGQLGAQDCTLAILRGE